MSELDHAPTATGEMLLDPFSYHRDHASAIGGLGGQTKPDDLGYALHTDYVRVAEGPAHFTLRFQGLRAKTGTLQLRVHIFVEGPPDRFLLANTVRIQLNRLVQLGGELSVKFEGVRGAVFALHGAVLGETDATATGLDIALDRPASDGEAEDGQAAIALRNTEFGSSDARPVPLLLTDRSASFAHPISQVATQPQLGEPECEAWLARLDTPAADPRARWSAAYVLQAIRVYGLWQEGAHGLGFGAGAEAIAGVLGQAGVSAEMAQLPDLPEQLPGALGDVDFLWSIDAVTHNGMADAFTYVERLQTCVRPGGLAIHVVPFVPGREQRAQTPATTAFRRGEIERLALAVIGRGDEAAQLEIVGEDALLGQVAGTDEPVGAFGLIFRRAPLRDG